MSSDKLLRSFRLLEDGDEEEKGRKQSRSLSILSDYSQYTDPDAPLEYVSLNHSSTFSCYINLLNTIIGSGVLGLPYAVGYSGLVLGIILIIFFGALNIFSCHLLTLCAAKVSPPASFYNVTANSVPKLTFMIDFAVALQSFGVCASYLIVIGGLMPDVMDNFKLTGFWIKREPWILLGFAVVAPLSCFKKVDALKYTSGLSVMFVCFLTLLILLYSIPGDSLDPCSTDDDEGIEDNAESCVGDKPMISITGNTFRVLSIYIYGLAVQPNIFQVVNEIRNPAQKRIDNVTVMSLSTALGIYTLVAVTGFITYGDAVESNILISYPNTTLTSTARIFVSLLVAFSYPLLVHPGRNSMLGLWRGFDTEEDAWLRYNKRRYVILTIAILGTSLGTSLLVKDLGVIFSFLGATSSTMVSLILPGIAYYNMHYDEAKTSLWKLYGSLFILGLGCVITPLCLAFLFI